MKTNSHSKITFSQAINGYLLAAQSHHLSQHMIEDNLNTFRKFGAFIDGDPPLITLSPNDVEAFLAAQTTVSKKTILNYHIGLSALWTWAVGEGLADVHIVHQVERARPEKRQIVPYSEEDIKAMLAALGSSRLYSRPGKKECQNSLPNFERNRATILVLLDTGIRAEEMVELRIHQVDTRNRRLTVFGKGGKERTIPFCARTGQALWRYLAARRDEPAGGFLFSTMDNGPLDRHDLRKTMVRIGMRAGVRDVTVHRFRHTFAINYLRNGGDPYSLQMMLGHSTMEMVKNYLAQAEQAPGAESSTRAGWPRWAGLGLSARCAGSFQAEPQLLGLERAPGQAALDRSQIMPGGRSIPALGGQSPPSLGNLE